MINSLTTDSHIPHNFAFQNSKYRQNVVHKKGLHLNQGINVNKPAVVSFGGFSSQVDFVTKEGPVKKLLEKIYDEEKNREAAKKTIVKIWNNFEDTSVSQDIRKIVEENKKELTDAFEDIKTMVKKGDKNNKWSNEKLEKEAQWTIQEIMSIFHTAKNPGKIYKSKLFEKFLNYASSNQIGFSAVYAACLACCFRPLTILAISDKKNKDNNKYAAGQSIASGTIGVVASILYGSPIAKGIEKIKTNPNKYLGNFDFKYLGKIDTITGKLSGSGFDSAIKYLNMGPESVLAIPKAILTIAIIPPVLKYCFGLEKKAKPAENKQEPSSSKVNVPTKTAFKPVTGEIK